MLSLNEKAAHAVTYFEALQANPNNTKEFAIDKLEYSVNEAEEVVKLWCDCFVEMTKNFTWEEVVELAQAPVTNEEEEKRTSKTPVKPTKQRTKIKGIKARFQSDVDGVSYINVTVSIDNQNTRQVLNKLEDIMTCEDWGYYCAECTEGEGAVFFGDNEKTIKQMKDDYKAALKLALN